MTREEAKELKDKIYKVDFDYEGDDFIDKIYDDFENEIEKTKTKWHKIISFIPPIFLRHHYEQGNLFDNKCPALIVNYGL